jgi:NAD(P)H-flavin reductase
MNKNPYFPFKAEILKVTSMPCEVKLFRVKLTQKIDYLSGQFFMVGKWGAGEVPISITSTSENKGYLEFAIKKVGKVTTALHKLKKGDILWIRGPYGNGFSMNLIKESLRNDTLFVAGGIGIVPLRPVINYLLKNKNKSSNIFLLYGVKNPREFLFKKDINSWKKKGMRVSMTVDEKDRSWRGNVGFVTDLIKTINLDFTKLYAYICGPEVMIDKAMRMLSERGMPDTRIITTLEARMKCGTGKCGQCYRGKEYICTNGPVYTLKDLNYRVPISIIL